ncbi:hypothetical protein [Zavarzinia sp. CC-PAN008]|uniref:hypothetical protein n=1 Tax=Zavarzinia sp. CC-PAN008 TaxID=3243332 RepID=UPI003F7467B3
MLMLLDGFVDLGYPAARAVVLPALEALQGPDRARADRPAGWDDYRFREVPGLGKLVEPIAAPGLNVDALGRRATGNPPRNGPHGVLLGSSPTFGFHVADDATLAAALERRRTDVTVASLAGPARTTPESMANWARVEAALDAPDFGILVFGYIDVFLACWPSFGGAEPVAERAGEHQPALVTVPARLLRRLSPPSDTPCRDPEVQAALVERSLYELRSALAYGRTRTPHFVVVVPPTVFGTDADVAALRTKVPPAVAQSLDTLIRAIRARLAADAIPGVIDLSALFDADGMRYLIDSGSHFSAAGADLLAEEILRQLPDDFFSQSRG